MNPLRVVVMTQGGLGVEVSRRVARLPDVQLAVIVQEFPRPKKWPLRERVRRNLRYYGCFGTLRRVAQASGRRLFPKADSADPGDARVLQAIAREHSAQYVEAVDLHAPHVLDAIRAAEPDLGLIVGTTIVKHCLYALPRLGSLNLHQGKVPEYRGSAPEFWALFNNETDYAVTVHRVVDRVDAGDVVFSATVPFEYDFDRYRLDYERYLRDFRESLGPLSVDVMVEAVRRIAAGTHAFAPQDESKAVRRRIPTWAERKAMRLELQRRLRNRRVSLESCK